MTIVTGKPFTSRTSGAPRRAWFGIFPPGLETTTVKLGFKNPNELFKVALLVGQALYDRNVFEK